MAHPTPLQLFLADGYALIYRALLAMISRSLSPGRAMKLVGAFPLAVPGPRPTFWYQVRHAISGAS